MGSPDQTKVDDDGERFYVRTDAGVAELVYSLEGRRLVLLHTGVPPANRRRGVGGSLVSAAVERAAEEGLVLVPLCSFARQWLARHQAETAGVSIDWRGA